MHKKKIYLLGLFLLLVLISFTNCSSDVPVYQSRTHFTLPRGTKKGELGKSVYKGRRFFPMDRALFSSAFCVDFDKFIILDKNNRKIMVFELSGQLIKELPLKNFFKDKNVQLLSIAQDDEAHIFFSGIIKEKTEERFYIWYLKSLLSAPKTIYTRKIERQKTFSRTGWDYLLRRPGKLFAIAENRCVITWETLRRHEPFANRYNAKENRAISDFYIIDATSKKVEQHSLSPKLFPKKSGNDAQFQNIGAVYPVYDKQTLILEIIYKTDNSQAPFRKKIISYNLQNKKCTPVKMPIDQWHAFFGVSLDNKLYLLDSTIYDMPVVKAIFRSVTIDSSSSTRFMIKSNPKKFPIGNFYFSNSGKIYSFIPALGHITVISWN